MRIPTDKSQRTGEKSHRQECLCHTFTGARSGQTGVVYATYSDPQKLKDHRPGAGPKKESGYVPVAASV
ncbi:MAG TPA: hypothetical protein VFW31_11575, partial [Candidatus Angelobacter sp.]|nr:hypothetical protein [Candidatus Angelobacter sp.]